MQDLLQVINGGAIALTIKGFYEPKQCQAIANKIQKNSEGGYLNAPTIGKLGMAYFETDNVPELIDTYYDRAIPTVDFIRNICSPYTSPMDLLRLKLDEIWEPGAKIESFHNRKMFTGICRIVEPNVDFLPHQDVVARDIPDNYNASSLLAQLAANIYLSTANEGGKLNIWDLELSKAKYDELRQDSYGIDRSHFGEPDVVIKPAAGDLFIFNARKMHAVAASFGKSRIAMSIFIGYRGAHSPLTFWS